MRTDVERLADDFGAFYERHVDMLGVGDPAARLARAGRAAEGPVSRDPFDVLRDRLVEVMPDLTAGKIGWCASTTMPGVGGGRGCEPAGARKADRERVLAALRTQ